MFCRARSEIQVTTSTPSKREAPIMPIEIFNPLKFFKNNLICLAALVASPAFAYFILSNKDSLRANLLDQAPNFEQPTDRINLIHNGDKSNASLNNSAKSPQTEENTNFPDQIEQKQLEEQLAAQQAEQKRIVILKAKELPALAEQERIAAEQAEQQQLAEQLAAQQAEQKRIAALKAKELAALAEQERIAFTKHSPLRRISAPDLKNAIAINGQKNQLVNLQIKAPYSIQTNSTNKQINERMKASRYFQRGEYASSIKSLNIALSATPNNSSLYLERGQAKELAGDQRSAILDYNKAIQLNPNDQGAYLARASSLEKQGEKFLALDDYNKAIKISPLNQTARLKRGALLSEFGDKQKAITDFSIIISFIFGIHFLFLLSKNRAVFPANFSLVAKSQSTLSACFLYACCISLKSCILFWPL